MNVSTSSEGNTVIKGASPSDSDMDISSNKIA